MLKPVVVAILILAAPTLAHTLPIFDDAGTMLIDANGVTVCCWGPLATIQPVASVQPVATVLPVLTVDAPITLTESAIVLFAAAPEEPLTHTPEPATLALLGGTLAGLGWVARRRRGR